MFTFDKIFDALLPLLDSWLLVHVTIAAPFLFMLVNFLRGQCDVADAVGIEQRTKSGIQSKIHVTLMALAFAWQIHAVWFVAVPMINQAKSMTMLLLLDLTTHLHVLGCAAYVVFVFLIWKRAADERNSSRWKSYDEYKKHDDEEERKRDAQLAYDRRDRTATVKNSVDEEFGSLAPIYDESRVSFCRTCQFAVHGRDHHCGWMAVCIGSCNRTLFVGAIFSAFIFATADVATGCFVLPPLLIYSPPVSSLTAEQFAEQQSFGHQATIIYLLAGFLLSLGASAFTGMEALTQLYLMWRKETKLGRKRRAEVRKERKRLLFVGR